MGVLPPMRLLDPNDQENVPMQEQQNPLNDRVLLIEQAMINKELRAEVTILRREMDQLRQERDGLNDVMTVVARQLGHSVVSDTDSRPPPYNCSQLPLAS